MSASRSISFDSTNRGGATLLNFRREDYFDVANKGLMLKAKRKGDKADAKTNMLKDVKSFDSWKHYSPSIQSAWNEVLDRVKNGSIDDVDMKREILRISNAAKSSLQMQDEFKSAKVQYNKDKKVSPDAAKWYLNKFHATNDIQSLEDRQTEDVTPYGFLDEEGGSQFINRSEAFSDVVNTTFKDFLKEKFQSPAFRKRIGMGLFQLDQQQLETEVKKFAEYDKETGTIRVKNPEALIEEGVLDVFLQDPYTERIIEDEAIARTEGNPTDDVRSQILSEMLEPYSTGTVTDKTNIKTAREAVDFQGIRGRREQDSALRWLEDVRSGDPEALGFIEGGKDGSGTVTSSGIEDGGLLGQLPYISVRKKVDGEETVIDEAVDVQNLNDEQLLRYYNMGRKSRATDYNDYRSKKDKENKTTLKNITKPGGLLDIMPQYK